ncbi:hypothetical protein KH172YL63_33560 [Bacillus sp. KH172YL63]|nr:hypothetical protein KH172YL63_33560 [Bacillus sp. KH172YL63]
MNRNRITPRKRKMDNIGERMTVNQLRNLDSLPVRSLNPLIPSISVRIDIPQRMYEGGDTFHSEKTRFARDKSINKVK